MEAAPTPLALETPIVIGRCSTSRSRGPLLCARCLRSAASPSVQLSLSTGAITCKALRRGDGVKDLLPVDGLVRAPVTFWCTEGTCIEAYCSAECREQHRPKHMLLCDHGGMADGAPLQEFHRLARRQPDEALALSAALIAEGVADILHAPSEAAGVLSRLENCIDVSSMASTSNGLDGGGQESGQSSRGARRQQDERDAAVEEGWELLRLGLLERVPDSSRSAAAPLLDRSLFERCVACFEQRLLPIDMPSPLLAYCTALSRGGGGGGIGGTASSEEEHQGRQRVALRVLLGAVRRRWPLRTDKAAMSTAEQLDALLAQEAADAAAEEAEEVEEVAATASAVARQRRLSLMRQCAERLFPPVAFMAYARCTASVGHSCVPNAQLQLAKETSLALGALPPPGLPSLPKVALVALRPKHGVGEPTSMAWVDVSESHVGDRNAAVCRRFRLASYECVCERCCYERAGLQQLERATTTTPHVMLARDAMEDGRYSEAVAMLRTRLDGALDDGDAWMLLGTALLGLDRWTEAHAVWRRGVSLAPDHELLAKQQLKCSRFEQPVANGPPLFDAPGPPSVDDKVHTLRSNGGKLQGAVDREPLVAMSGAPLFTAAECAAAIDAAERHATQGGGWTTVRHHSVPTTDVPIYEVPELLAWFNAAMARRLGPMLARSFGVCSSRLRVHDAFLVRYVSGAQTHLPLHVDESHISLTIVLNDEFAGGGTYFADLRRALSPSRGHVVAFDGNVLHGGEPIVSGRRYIIAAFLYVDDGDDVPLETSGARRPAPALESLFAPKRARQQEQQQPADNGGGGFAFNF